MITNSSVINFVYNLSYFLVVGCISLLLVFLPIYTPITTYLINIHQAPYWIVLWKEGLTVILVLALSFGMLIKFLTHKNRMNQLQKLWPLLVGLVLSSWILLLSFLNHIPIKAMIYGFRFELWWVLVYALVLSWGNVLLVSELGVMEIDKSTKKEIKASDSAFQIGLLKQFLIQISRVSVYAGLVFSSTFAWFIYLYGQTKALLQLGYGMYQGDSAYLNPVICHPVDAFQEGCRLSGGFTLPNHYAGYLLLVLGFLLYRITSENSKKLEKIIAVFLSISTTLLIILTYSRFALLGLGILYGWLLLNLFVYVLQSKLLGKVEFFNSMTSALNRTSVLQPLIQLFVVALCIIPMLIGVVGINLSSEQLSKLPIFLSKPNSTNEHYKRTMANVDIIKDNPGRALTGYGLGTSGPAAKPEYSDISANPISSRYFYLANYKWLIGNSIFVPENWYIQLILNGGIAYMMVYVYLVGYFIWRLIFRVVRSKTLESISGYIRNPETYLIMAFLTIMIGNLFLHIWENQTLALYYALLPLFIINPNSSDKKTTYVKRL